LRPGAPQRIGCKVMRKLTPDKLEAGMVLAKPILRGSAVFLGEGSILSEGVISRLQSMEINYVYVEGLAEQPIPLDEALASLDARFGNSGDSEPMARIKRIVHEYIVDLYE